MRIGFRILVGTFLLVAIAAITLTQVFLAQVKPGVRQTMEDTLVDTANVLAELAADDLAAGRIADGQFAARVRAATARNPEARIWGFPKETTSIEVSVTDARGIVRFDSSGRNTGADHARWNDVARTLRGAYGARSSVADPSDSESTVMHVAAPIRDADGTIIGVLTVAKPNRTIAPFIERSRTIIQRWGIVLLLAALLIGAVTAAWLSRQLGLLRRYAQAVTAGERAPLPRTAGEFAELGQALETMRARLEGKQYVERYVQSLTHELKSPLAAIRASAELLEEPLPAEDHARFVAAIRSQGDRLVSMVDRLLALAAVEQRQRIEAPERVRLKDLLEAIVTDCLPTFAEAGRTLELAACDASLEVDGDPFLLRAAVQNLIDNALAFSPARGHVQLAAVRAGEVACITVRDDGPGVPEFARTRVFERFFSLPRPDGGDRSSGIGLSFVAEVAALHGGKASLDNRPEGGAEARLELPLAPSVAGG